MKIEVGSDRVKNSNLADDRKFSGEFLHSHNYKKAEPFRDKRVLVIGGGNSACDVAVETSRISKSTSISWRRGYYLIPKFMFGLTSDVFGLKSRWLPRFIRLPFMKVMLEMLQGKNEDIGLPKVTNHILATKSAYFDLFHLECLIFNHLGQISPYQFYE